MPKLPHISGAQAVKIFEHLGFVMVRQNGSHIILRKGSTDYVVPNHKEIKIGTLAGSFVRLAYRQMNSYKHSMTN